MASFVNFRGKLVDSNLTLLNQTLQVAAVAMVVFRASGDSGSNWADKVKDDHDAKASQKKIKPHP